MVMSVEEALELIQTKCREQLNMPPVQQPIKITCDMYPEIIWKTLTEDGEWINQRPYKRDKLVDIVFHIDAEICQKYLENRTELIGDWLAKNVTVSYDWGIEDIIELARCERREKMTVTYEWVPVDTPLFTINEP
jgi:hypothetical protein